MSGFDVYIVDDNSDDPATQDVLRRWAPVFPRLDVVPQRGERKTGGLYPNMCLALDHASNSGYEYALFTQDDMQFVRPFDQRDVALVDRYFEDHQSAIQLLVHFIKRPAGSERSKDTWCPDESGMVLLRRSQFDTGKTNFCAGGIFDVRRTKAELGAFRSGEMANSDVLKERGIYYGASFYPLISFLPAPVSYRGKRRSLEHRFYEYLGGAGFHPISLMTAAEVEAFWNRGRSEFPVAEHFLSCPTAPVPENWAAGGGDYLIVARGGWRALLYRVISVGKQMVKRVLRC